ncbi:DUF4416 family protein, partial [archaeon]|nr:DUF4416 family protein [archaeon]
MNKIKQLKLKKLFSFFMSVPKQPKNANLIISLMYRDEKVYNEVLEILIKEFGEIKKQTEVFDFNFTKFYEEEFGKELKKIYLIFDQIQMVDIVKIKHYCFQIEMKYSQIGQRFINIDCGYVTKNSFVLASFKERAHRIFVGDGVYVDLQLVKENKEWKSFKWTFPDIDKIKK